MPSPIAYLGNRAHFLAEMQIRFTITNLLRRLQMTRILLVMLFLLPSIRGAVADEVMPEFASVGGWSVRVDTSVGYGCFLVALYEEGSYLRIGLNPEDSKLHVFFGDDHWKSIEHGKKYDIAIRFGNESPWTATARGFSFDPPEDEPVLRVDMPLEADSLTLFFKEFMEERSVGVYYDDDRILLLSLEDSSQATSKLFECQEAMAALNSDPASEGKPTSENDPFIKSKYRDAKDPFNR